MVTMTLHHCLLSSDLQILGNFGSVHSLTVITKLLWYLMLIRGRDMGTLVSTHLCCELKTTLKNIKLESRKEKLNTQYMILKNTNINFTMHHVITMVKVIYRYRNERKYLCTIHLEYWVNRPVLLNYKSNLYNKFSLK